MIHRVCRCLTVLLLSLSILPAAGCGGGTSGSGLKTFEGRVLSTDGRALAGVLITIESTGESSLTDSNGEFAIKSDASGDEVAFIVESSEFSGRFSLPDVPDSNSRITMEISVDTVADTVEVSNVRIHARFAGLCDYYFENREIIRQANKVPRGTVCSLNVEVRGDDGRLAGIPIALQYSGCEEGAVWETLQTEQTGSGAHSGFAEINFEFRDSPTYCRYRVVAPFGARLPASFPIDTFTEQEYFRK